MQLPPDFRTMKAFWADTHLYELTSCPTTRSIVVADYDKGCCKQQQCWQAQVRRLIWELGVQVISELGKCRVRAIQQAIERGAVLCHVVVEGLRRATCTCPPARGVIYMSLRTVHHSHTPMERGPGCRGASHRRRPHIKPVSRTGSRQKSWSKDVTRLTRLRYRNDAFRSGLLVCSALLLHSRSIEIPYGS